MRAVLPWLFLVVLGASAFAQTQDRKLLDRMLKPDLQQGNPLGGKEFNPGGAMELRAAGDSRRAFETGANAGIREFPFTRSFLGVKNPWFGNKVYDARKAGEWADARAFGSDRTFEARDARVTTFADENKKANFGSPEVPVQPFLVRGGAQGALSEISEKVSKDMTIDEVRELLNKPR
ncbi:MAG: hypothetical protein SFU53_02155 [Terrimicrobiaceae bacterium]|nr:hypothetical protein [Terrimicrobiaceae bacterium]